MVGLLHSCRVLAGRSLEAEGNASAYSADVIVLEEFSVEVEDLVGLRYQIHC